MHASEPTPDFGSPAFVADPYPAYRRLRERDPVHQSPWGDWYLSRHAYAERLLEDPAFARESPGGSGPLAASAGRAGALERLIGDWLVFRDPPFHTRIRRWLGQRLGSRALEALAPQVQAAARQLLDARAGAPQLDVVADLAYPLPVIVIAELIGLPVRDRTLFAGWSRAITRALDRGLPQDMDEAAPAVREMTEYLERALAERRRRPREDLVTALAREPLDARRLTEHEALASLAFLLWAGHETTRSLIGNAVQVLLAHPGEQRRLRRHPELMGSAIEEFLRFESPLQKISRWTRVAVEFDGRRVPEGRLVVALVGAANRDPAVFDAPETPDLGRAPNLHLAFGGGIHHCLGAPLARLEARIAIGAVLERFAHMTPAAAPEWRPLSAFRSLERLPISTAPA
jgi:cytochrome P450